MKIFSKFLALIILTLVGYSLTSAHASAFDLFSSPCNGVNAAGSTRKHSDVCKSNNSAQNDNGNNNVVLRTINTAIGIIALVAGLAAVIIIIISGIGYITSAGSADQAKTARNRILWAAIGLIVIATSWSISSFILNKVL
jgi:amino acid transporter